MRREGQYLIEECSHTVYNVVTNYAEDPVAETAVGVRELKARLSKYLQQVKAGRSIVITERGKAVGRLVPNAQSLEEKLLAMVKSGRAEWNGSPLKPMKAIAKVKEGYSVADLLVEDRR
jgi:prevent-host-death family protein